MEGMGAREASHILLVPVCREWSPPVLPEWPFSPRPAAGTQHSGTGHRLHPRPREGGRPRVLTTALGSGQESGCPSQEGQNGWPGPESSGTRSRAVPETAKDQESGDVLSTRGCHVLCAARTRGAEAHPRDGVPGLKRPRVWGNVARTPWWPTDPGAQSRDHGTARGCCRPGWRRVSRRCAAGEGGHTKGGQGTEGSASVSRGKEEIRTEL